MNELEAAQYLSNILASSYGVTPKDTLNVWNKYCLYAERHWGLTKAESETLYCLLQGKSNEEIATIRKLSKETINKMLDYIYAKSMSNTRMEVASKLLANADYILSMQWINE